MPQAGCASEPALTCDAAHRTRWSATYNFIPFACPRSAQRHGTCQSFEPHATSEVVSAVGSAGYFKPSTRRRSVLHCAAAPERTGTLHMACVPADG